VQILARARFRHCGMTALLVWCAAYNRNEGNNMKRISTALVVTALLALGACGSRTANNVVATDNLTNDVYDVAPDSLTANDLGNDSGNATSSGNASSGSNASSANSATSNASGNSH
jgi:hypothetical protein